MAPPGHIRPKHDLGTLGRFTHAGASPLQNAFTTTTSLSAGLRGIVSLCLSKPGFPWSPVEELVDRLRSGMIGVA